MANLVANVTISGNTLILAASSNVQYINAASSNIFTFASGVATVNRFPAVASGGISTAILMTDGTVKTFGYNGDGRLGLGDKTDRVVPVTVPGIAGATGVSMATSHGAVLLSDGTVRTFGDNTYGQLGINVAGGSRLTPVTVLNITSAIGVAAGGYHTAVLLSNGTVQTFGRSFGGELGVGDNTSRQTPVQVLNITSATAVSCGRFQTGVLLADGTVRMFGINDRGQLGINDTGTTRNTPTQVWGISSSAVAVASGAFNTLVLLANGTVLSFGGNNRGMLGVNDTTNRPTPVQVWGISSSATAISVGDYGSAILLADGTVRRFGSNTDGGLGIDVSSGTRQTPVQVFGISSSATDVACGSYNTVVLLSNGTLRTFGNNTYGQLGLGDTASRLTPVQVVSALSYGGGVGKVAGGGYHTAVILADRTVRAVGRNDSGQLGVNDRTNRFTPVQVFGISSSAVAVAGGSGFTAVLLADGTVRTFGDNFYGNLGIDVAGGTRQTPVQVFGISSSATAVACGLFHTAVLLADGTVRTFGYNNNGELGVNDNTNRATPEQVFGISSSATAVACGRLYTAVLLADGTVRTFGYNDTGQLGINDSGDFSSRLTPVQVFGISSSATAIACGNFHAAVLLADGTVRTVGANSSGQLGIDVSGGTRQTPVTVVNISTATAVACGWIHTIVLLADGTVRTFGSNDNGRLGIDVSGGTRQTPVQVFGISSSAVAIACGKYHTIVLLADGTVRTFGRNISYGQLGVNDTTSRQTPVQVLNIYTAGSLASTTFLTSAQTPFTFNGPVFTTNLGLGRVPDLNYQLDLSSDGARKLQSSTWTTGSDRRIKSDIQTANLARCAEIVDSLDLKYFEWLSAEHTDKHSLGWIAQDVLTFFPKSVSLTQSGTLALDSDQLVKVLWGALKHTLNEHFAPEVPAVSEPETVPESLSVDPGTEASENTVEVPEVTEPVPEVTEVLPVPAVTEPVTEVTEPVPEVTEVPVVPEVTEPVPEVTEVPPVSEPVPEVPATTESLSVDPGTEASENLSEPVPEPVPEVPVVAEPVPVVTEVPVVPEVTEVPQVAEVTEPVPEVTEPVAEVTEVPAVPEVTEPVAEVTEVPAVPEVTEVTEVPAVSEPVVEVPATTESLSVPEASESLSENTVEVPVVTEPVTEVPAAPESVPE
jgi:alpha-tubulin suppressor-like RCC1 family protein